MNSATQAITPTTPATPQAAAAPPLSLRVLATLRGAVQRGHCLSPAASAVLLTWLSSSEDDVARLQIIECLLQDKVDTRRARTLFDAARPLAACPNPFVSLRACRALVAVARFDLCLDNRARLHVAAAADNTPFAGLRRRLLGLLGA
jgi:hypothetical protein